VSCLHCLSLLSPSPREDDADSDTVYINTQRKPPSILVFFFLSTSSPSPPYCHQSERSNNPDNSDNPPVHQTRPENEALPHQPPPPGSPVRFFGGSQPNAPSLQQQPPSPRRLRIRLPGLHQAHRQPLRVLERRARVLQLRPHQHREFSIWITVPSPCRLAVCFESSQFSKNLFLLFSDDVVQREPVKLLMGPSGQLADFVQSKFRQNVPAANGSMARTARRVGSSAVPGMMGLGLCVFEENKRGPEEEKGTGWRVAVDISTCRLANPSPTCSVVLFGRTECRGWES
jgi:hypothetical protein